MSRVIIIGSGFAGISCALRLKGRAKKNGLEITLISDKKNFSFLPLLPDCLGRMLDPEILTFDTRVLIEKSGFNFLEAEVTGIDLTERQVCTEVSREKYDFLVLASGSQTNFYGNRQIEENSLVLDDVFDARHLSNSLKREDISTYIISGAGYTGVEIASNISLYIKRNNLNKKILLIEKAPSILGPLPQWMKDYCYGNLVSMGVEILTGVSVEKVTPLEIKLSNTKSFNNALLIWASGVKAADFVQSLRVDKNAQGRIKVDSYLSFSEHCFAAGDAAFFEYNGNPLRMAIQFAIMEGKVIADNLIRITQSKKPVKYCPRDLGYIIPMANNKSCGSVLGINLKGALPTFLHYFMCAYRLRGLKKKVALLTQLLAKGGK